MIKFIVPRWLPVKPTSLWSSRHNASSTSLTYDLVLRWLPVVCQGNFSASVRNSRAPNTSCVLLAAGVLPI